jgi:peptidyl-prolyl cis-trans isomerase B (cyclophilin B)
MRTLSCFLLAFILVFALSSAEDKKAGNATPAEKKQNTEKNMKEKKMEYQKRKAGNPEIAIETDFGTMKLELFRDVAPIHVDSMLSRIRSKFYDGLTFHRVIDGFMIQGGDPKGNGTGNAGYFLPAEFSKLPHLEGTLSMARAQDPNSASCQFFICLADVPHLNGQYTVFGQLMEGYDVLHKIGKVETGAADKPLKPIYIRKMTIIKDVDAKTSEKKTEKSEEKEKAPD